MIQNLLTSLGMNVWTVLSLSDLPKPMEYTAAEETEKPRVGRCWWEVGKIVPFKGEPMWVPNFN